jgi:hypothetical protein
MKAIATGVVLSTILALTSCADNTPDRFIGKWVVEEPVNPPHSLYIIQKQQDSIRVIDAFVNDRGIVSADTFSALYDSKNDKLIMHILTQRGCIRIDQYRNVYFLKNNQDKLVFEDEATFQRITDIDSYFKVKPQASKEN